MAPLEQLSLRLIDEMVGDVEGAHMDCQCVHIRANSRRFGLIRGAKRSNKVGPENKVE